VGEVDLTRPGTMHNVTICCKATSLEALKQELSKIGITGMTVSQVTGFGIQKGADLMYRGVQVDARFLPKVKVEVVVGNLAASKIVEAAKRVLYTGHIGDGKIFVYGVEKVVKVRTSEEDLQALIDEDVA
jgi:Amt family ammonium transporter